MDPHTSPHRAHAVVSPFAASTLRCSEEVADEVAQLTAPYFDVVPGAAPEDHWTVATAADVDPALVREVISASGEEPLTYAVDHARRHLFHVSPRDRSWQVQSLLRATRAVHRSEASDRGMLLVHAGILDVGGRGVLLVGGSRSGKTSLIMASVLGGHGTMVCNDDAGVVPTPGGAATGIGWPRSISVRLDTFDVLLGTERAADVRRGLRHPANRTLDRLRRDGTEPHGTALMYPDEYVALTGAPIRREVELCAVVHLSLADTPEDAELMEVPAERAAGLLHAQVLPEPNKHLNIFGHRTDPRAWATARERVLGLPTFGLRYRFDRAEDAGAELAALVTGLPRLPLASCGAR